MYKIIIFTLIVVAICGMFLYGQQRPIAKQVSNLKNIAALFDLSGEDIDFLVESGIESFKKLVSAIENAPENPSYQDTFGALDQLILSDFYILKNIFSVIEMVHPEAPMRDKAHKAAQKMVSLFISQVSSNRRLYDALMRFLNQNTLTYLTNQEQYFVKDTILAFQRDGMHLDVEKRDQLEKLKQEIADAAMSFQRTILEDKTVLWISIADLLGAPSFFIDSLEKSPDDATICAVRLDYPTVETILKECVHVATRKKVWLAFNNRGYPENDQHLRTLVNKRQEFSSLLGYNLFVDYDLNNQMAENILKVDSFLTDLFIKSYKKGAAEFDSLYKLSVRNNIVLTDNGKLFPWDISFLKELYKKEHGLIDDQEIAEYFPLERTINGLFEIYQNLFSIKFKKVLIEKLWHENVECIQVYSKNDQLLGTLLIDLFPRVGKYSHACHIDVIQACCINTGIQQGLSVVLANFSPASSDRPSLLKLSEVRTFFHEFGHALHSLLGATEIASLSGTNTKLDFVELPSQLLEEWLWEHDILKRLSYHFETGQSLPDQVIKKIIELKNFDAALVTQRQIYLSRLSLVVHVARPNEDFSVLAHDLHEQYMPYVAWVDDAHMYCSFGHLGGYSSRYYSYLWSRVFAADIFAVFKDKGLRNPYVGSLYVDAILKPGGTKDPNILLENFLGRQPTVDAFFKRLDF